MTSAPTATTTAPAASPAKAKPPEEGESLAPVSSTPIVLAFSPELGDPQLALVRGGDFIVCLPYEEKFLTLTPGNNTVDPEMWEVAKTIPAVETLLDQSLIEEIDMTGATVLASPAAGVISVRGISDKSALRLIHHCRDAEQLQRWHDEDDRVKIRNAIKRRILVIEGGDA
jgi:hypothetical protein